MEEGGEKSRLIITGDLEKKRQKTREKKGFVNGLEELFSSLTFVMTPNQSLK